MIYILKFIIFFGCRTDTSSRNIIKIYNVTVKNGVIDLVTCYLVFLTDKLLQFTVGKDANLDISINQGKVEVFVL